MTPGIEKYQITPFPKSRHLMVDGGRLGRLKHTIHGLYEVDVTLARQTIAARKAHTGESLSFTAFVIACLGKAIGLDKQMHAYRSWRDRLVVFDEVDINTLFEVEVDGRQMIRPHVIRAANLKSLREIHEEVRAFQADHARSRESRAINWLVLLPGFVRRGLLRLLFKNPHYLKEQAGTVLLSSVGMFGMGGFWGIPVPNHTLQITLGGITRKPGVIEDRIEIREYLSVTISFDHDIVDGAPATRFAQRLKELIESGHGLFDGTPVDRAVDPS